MKIKKQSKKLLFVFKNQSIIWLNLLVLKNRRKLKWIESQLSNQNNISSYHLDHV